MNFEERVILNEFQLNETDDEVIEYIRKHRNSIKKYSINKIAEDLYTVPNTIMRVCKKLGYNGFSEMKVLISNENRDISNELGYSKIPKSITKTLELLDEEKLYLVADMMKKAETCHFIGVGDSRACCEMMVKNLRCQDKSSASYVDYHDIDYRVAHCHSNDLLIFISVKGNNDRLIEIAKKARKRNINIVTITHLCENNLAKNANISLYFWGEPRQVNGYNVTDRLGLELLLRQLSEIFWRIYWI